MVTWCLSKQLVRSFIYNTYKEMPIFFVQHKQTFWYKIIEETVYVYTSFLTNVCNWLGSKARHLSNQCMTKLQRRRSLQLLRWCKIGENEDIRHVLLPNRIDKGVSVNSRLLRLFNQTIMLSISVSRYFEKWAQKDLAETHETDAANI